MEETEVESERTFTFQDFSDDGLFPNLDEPEAVLMQQQQQQSKRNSEPLQKRGNKMRGRRIFYNAFRASVQTLHMMVELALVITAVWAINNLITQDVSNVKKQVRDVQNQLNGMQSEHCKFLEMFDQVKNFSGTIQHIYKNISGLISRVERGIRNITQEVDILDIEVNVLSKEMEEFMEKTNIFINQTISSWSLPTFLISIFGCVDGSCNTSIQLINFFLPTKPMSCDENKRCLSLWTKSGQNWGGEFSSLYYCSDVTIIDSKCKQLAPPPPIHYENSSTPTLDPFFTFTRSDPFSGDFQTCSGHRISLTPGFAGTPTYIKKKNTF